WLLPAHCQVHNLRSRSSLAADLQTQTFHHCCADLEDVLLRLVILVRPVGRLHVTLQFIDRDAELGRHVFKIPGRRLLVISRALELFQRLLARHLFGDNQAGVLNATSIKAKLLRQPESLIEPGEPRLKMLLRIWLPTELFHQQLHRFAFNVAHVIERAYHANSLNVREINFVPENVRQRETYQRSRAKLAMDVSHLDDVSERYPFDWISDAFRRKVGSRQDVLNVVLVSKLVHRGEKRQVLRPVEMRYSGLEKSQLQIPHLFPINNFSKEIQSELVDQLLDVIDGLL